MYTPPSVRCSIVCSVDAAATPGSGFHRTICSHENTTVLAPMPIASDTITTADTSGIARKARQA